MEPNSPRGRHRKSHPAGKGKREIPFRRRSPHPAEQRSHSNSEVAKLPSTGDESTAEQGVRLQKFLATAGVGSRRKCEDLILAGRVAIDGKVVSELGVRVDPRKQRVHLDGEQVRYAKRRYFLLHKPAGYLCTNNDPSGRLRAVDLVPFTGKLFTVGRLDENSEGLLLVTNDGDLAEKLAHPRFGVLRRYKVQVAGKPTWESLEQLKRGLRFAEGTFRIQHIGRINHQGKSSFLEIDLAQGRNREIRRLFAKIGHKVMYLQRLAFGPLQLGRLPRGKSRPLKPHEVQELREFADGGGDRSEQGRSKRKPAGKKFPKRSRSRPQDRQR